MEARLELVSGWRSAGRTEGMRNVLKVNEVSNIAKEKAYQKSLHGKYEELGEGRQCGEAVGKIQRYSNGVYQ